MSAVAAWLRALRRRALHAALSNGPRAALRALWTGITRPATVAPAPAVPTPPPATPLPEATSIHPFDITYGVDTSGLVWGEQLVSGHRNDTWSTAYYAIAPSVFNAALDRLAPAIGDEWHRFSFVDLGSGKGRALLLAASRPFQAIVGVELNPALFEISRKNIARFITPGSLAAPHLRCSNMHARLGDATAFVYPETPLIVFLYHPFLSPVLRRCLFQLDRSLRERPRDVWLLYVNPEFRRIVNHFPAFHREWSEIFPMSPQDVLADRNSSASEQVMAFRYAPASPTSPS